MFNELRGSGNQAHGLIHQMSSIELISFKIIKDGGNYLTLLGLLLFAVFCFISPNSSEAFSEFGDRVIVEGAGEPDVNQTYTYTENAIMGSFNAAIGDTNPLIVFNWAGSIYEIKRIDSLAAPTRSERLYWNPTVLANWNDPLPITGWIADAGASPPPTVREQGPTPPTAPILSETTDDGTASLSWNPVPGAVGYLLVFAPVAGSGSICSLDMGNRTGTTWRRWSGNTVYYAVILAYNSAGYSPISNVKVLFSP